MSRPSTTSPGSLNLRGADVGYNPVFLAHLLLDATRATLFVGAGKIDAALAAALAADGIRARADYDAGRRRARGAAGGGTLLRRSAPVDARPASSACRGDPVVEAINPSTLAKSSKTDAEAAYVRAR